MLIALFIVIVCIVIVGYVYRTRKRIKKGTSPAETHSVDNDIFIPEIKRFIDEGKTVTITVRGYSMRVFVEHERDKVLLEPVKNLEIGDVVLARAHFIGRNGVPIIRNRKEVKRYVLHRLINRDGDDLVLKGDGNVYGVETCTTSDVVAKARGFYRKGSKKIDLVTGRKWRIYSYVWLKLAFMRRYLLAFYRRIWLKIFPVK